MTAPAPSNPFDLGTHLIDGHHQYPARIDPLDAEELRRLHIGLHSTWADHEHGETAS